MYIANMEDIWTEYVQSPWRTFTLGQSPLQTINLVDNPPGKNVVVVLPKMNTVAKR